VGQNDVHVADGDVAKWVARMHHALRDAGAAAAA
jgi:hypothetical protein